MRSTSLLSFLLGVICILGTHGFVWEISRSDTDAETYTFSELYMYGPQEAPFNLKLYKTSISVDLSVTIKNSSSLPTLSLVFLRTPKVVGGVSEGDELVQKLASDNNICSDDPITADGDHALQVERRVFRSLSKSKGHDRQYEIHASYHPKQSGIAAVLLAPCQGSNLLATEFSSVELDGFISFKNPYGFLPGMYFGYVPFEGTRATVFSIFGLLYLALLYVNRSVLMHVHVAIVAVIGIACLESALWFAAYTDINISGVPYCCPLPPLVISAMVVEMLRRTGSRALLLSLCMGWGTVQEQLHPTRLLSVILLSVGYLAASILADSKDITAYNDVEHESSHSMWWTFPELLLDLTFLIWIYLSLEDTMKTLEVTRQTFKLKMYTRLAYTMGIFIGMVSLLTFLIILGRGGVISWPWQVNWLESVAWEILNLGVLISVTVIWAPNERARLMATSQQLSVDEGDDDYEDTGIELPNTEFSEEPFKDDETADFAFSASASNELEATV